jgi:hypothetical protein
MFEKLINSGTGWRLESTTILYELLTRLGEMLRNGWTLFKKELGNKVGEIGDWRPRMTSGAHFNNKTAQRPNIMFTAIRLLIEHFGTHPKDTSFNALVHFALTYTNA